MASAHPSASSVAYWLAGCVDLLMGGLILKRIPLNGHLTLANGPQFILKEEDTFLRGTLIWTGVGVRCCKGKTSHERDSDSLAKRSFLQTGAEFLR